jgi:L-arabinonolactonase
VIVQLPTSATLSIACRCTLGEGILWWAERRSLIWTDIERSALWLHDIGRGVTNTLALPDRLGSLAICESGRLLLGLAKGLFAGTFDDPALTALRVERLTDVDAGLARHRINDGRTDRSGNFVFGTMNEAQDAPSGSFYQYSSTHGLRRLNLGGVTIPNSICFSLDGKTMYFCDSVAKRISQCDYDAGSAEVAGVREFVTLGPDEGLPDGSIVDREGCVWNAAWGVGRVRRYTPAGAMLGEIRVPAKNTTCVVFGGDDLTDLYITSSRQEMSDEDLAAVPDAGSVYHSKIAPLGVSDTPFRDTTP